ncbi:hypothetical protein PR003_g16664 [Phytophthora rubi]|uniref:Cas12f1-like TNB domain-containing protein n=1 Tax=Phytophthora rubi TaxID=129364 RepID=A0A6A3L8F5_9STRA|nr:hypothetical protein PR002_g16226 [Phytophthora rubi]KAE9012103.1 hypothetical protein PR001_g15745 [Phytophthora rubi]KAE9324713.1 hypothetical protein PR003_g16664 [Phytophthora rubi]
MLKKKTKPPNPRQSSARAAGKRSGAPSSPSTEPPKLSQFKVDRGRKRRILSSTARGMLGLCHYSFSELLRYKMERVGGKMITCEEEYTSKTCSGCGKLKENLGGSEVYKCVFCGAHMDRDLNGAKNILIKNIEMLF